MCFIYLHVYYVYVCCNKSLTCIDHKYTLKKKRVILHDYVTKAYTERKRDCFLFSSLFHALPKEIVVLRNISLVLVLLFFLKKDCILDMTGVSSSG